VFQAFEKNLHDFMFRSLVCKDSFIQHVLWVSMDVSSKARGKLRANIYFGLKMSVTVTSV